jgi:membrane protein YdbS with pleckstrin-like domain
MRSVNDNADTGSGPFAPSAIALLLPAALIVIGYGFGLAMLVASGLGDGSVARLCMIVLGLAAPFLVAHAVLRRVTTRLDIFSHAVHLQPGFPRNSRYVVPYGLIRSVRVRRGFGGWLTRTGTVSLELSNGMRLEACDLANPGRARDAIEAQMASTKAVKPPLEEAAEPAIRRVSLG